MDVARSESRAEPGDLPAVIGAIARDGSRLVRQQVELFRAEAGGELHKVVQSGGRVAGGAGLAAAGGLMAGFMAVHFLHRVTRLPLWMCYGLAAAGAGYGGLTLLRTGARDLVDVRFPRTTEALKENIEWLGNQANPAAG
jgi:hypothetical protein